MSQYLTDLITLWVVIDPVGTLPVFLAVTAGMSSAAPDRRLSGPRLRLSLFSCSSSLQAKYRFRRWTSISMHFRLPAVSCSSEIAVHSSETIQTL